MNKAHLLQKEDRVRERKGGNCCCCCSLESILGLLKRLQTRPLLLYSLYEFNKFFKIVKIFTAAGLHIVLMIRFEPNAWTEHCSSDESPNVTTGVACALYSTCSSPLNRWTKELTAGAKTDCLFVFTTHSVWMANRDLPTENQSINIGLSPNFYTFKEPNNRFQGINSASLCSLAGRYDNLFLLGS